MVNHPFGAVRVLHWDVSLFMCQLLPCWDGTCGLQGLESCLPLEFPTPGLALNLEEMLQNAWQWWSAPTGVREGKEGIWKNEPSLKKQKRKKKIGSYAESHVEGLVEQQKEIHYLAKGGLFKSNFRAQVGCQSRTLQKPGRLKQKWYRIQEFHWSGVLMERIALTRNTKGLYRKLSRKGQHVLWAWMSSWWLLGWNKGEATMKPWLHADPQLLHWLLQWSLAWSADVLL